MNDLRLFFDVARYRSFSLAARERDVSQSSASQRIQHLEEKLGVVLFDRSRRPLGLTPTGKKYYRGVREILSKYERLVVEIRENGENRHDVVRMASIYSAGIGMLFRLSREFQEMHPDISVNIEYMHPRDVERKVQLREYDLGVISYPESSKTLECIPLRNEIMVLACSPEHPLSGKTQADPTVFSGEPMVLLEPGLPLARHIQRYLKQHGVVPVIEHVFDNIDTVKSALSCAQSVSILPKCTIQSELEAGILKAVDLVPEIFRPVGFVHQKASRGRHAPLSSSAKALVDFFLEQTEKTVSVA